MWSANLIIERDDNLDPLGDLLKSVAQRILGQPNHELSRPNEMRFGRQGSLSVRIGGDRKGVWYDHEQKIGGGVLEFLKVKAGMDKPEAIEFLKEEFGSSSKPTSEKTTNGEVVDTAHDKRGIVATYDYHDEDGELHYQVVREAPKRFRQRQPNGQGGWIWNLDGVRRVPYQLPDIVRPGVAHDTIIVAEGEKDVDRLRDHGFVATCSPGGAGKWMDEYSPYFKEKTVYILADNDDAGRDHSQKVARSLYPYTDEVRIVQIPALPEKGDVSDWFDGGGEPGKLIPICKSAPIWRPANRQGMTARELQGMKFEPVRYVVPGLFPEGLTLFAGKPKIGKSWIALQLAGAVAAGGTALGMDETCEKGDVAYLALEDTPRRLRDRISKQVSEGELWSERLNLFTEWKRLGEGGLEDLGSWIGEVHKPRLIIIDTFVRFRKSSSRSREYSYGDDYEALQGLQQLAGERGVAIVIVHHLRKAESEDPMDMVSGTTGLTACADSIFVLRRDGHNSADAVLTGRGRDLEEIDWSLKFDPRQGLWTAMGPSEDFARHTTKINVMAALRNSDKPISPKDVATATGLSAEAIRQQLKRMADCGEIEKTARGRYQARAQAMKR